MSTTQFTRENRGHATKCWIWDEPNALGYGPYRRIYEDVFGEVPEGHDLHHECEQRACVEPTHLKPLTRQDHFNMHLNDPFRCGYIQGYAAGLAESNTPTGVEYQGVKDTAADLDVGERTVRYWASEGRIPSIKVGRDYLIPKGALPPR